MKTIPVKVVEYHCILSREEVEYLLATNQNPGYENETPQDADVRKAIWTSLKAAKDAK